MRCDEETQAALEAALAENRRLRAEVDQLKEELVEFLAPAPEPASSDSGAIPSLPSASGIGDIAAPAIRKASAPGNACPTVAPDGARCCAL